MSLGALYAELARLKAEKSKFEARRITVKKIIAQDQGRPVSETEDIRKAAGRTESILSGASKGCRRITDIVDECARKKLKACDLDHWEEKTALDNELNRINQKIVELEAQIRSVEAQIEAELAALAAAAAAAAQAKS